MKKGLYISILMAVAALFSSCEQEYTAGTDWGDFDIFRGYMQFSTGVSSRAQLATNLRGREFGVFGYQYNTTTTWQYAKATATPNVFYNQKVECDANGRCNYDINNTPADGNQYKQWEESHYSFFAYHPYGGSGITFSTQNDVNTPMLTYTYEWLKNSSQRIDATTSSDIFDLMTAEHIDADGSTNVGLDFKHRLFAIEVLANNYNENNYVYDEVPVKDENGEQVYDEEGNPVYEKVIRYENGEPVFAEDYNKTDAQGNLIKDENGNPILVKGNARQHIGMLTIKLEGLRHSSMPIPMSTRSGEAKPEYTTTTSFSKEFVISMNDVVVPAYNETMIRPDGKETGGGIPTSISKYGSNGGGYLMLIPQDAIEGQNYNIKFSLNWLNKPANSEEVKTDFEATIDFEPGRLYQVTINFVGSGITIALIEAGSWEPLTVTHTFE